MPSWNFSGVDFNSMTELPTWAFSHLPLNEYAEFIPHVNMYDADDEGFNEDQLSRRIREIKEEEEPTHVVDSIQSWNYPAASTHLQSRIQQLKEEEREQKEQKEEEEERIRQELYSQARDSEQPNSLSECSDYPQVTYLQLHEPLPRTDDSQVFHRNTRAGLSSPIRQSTFTFTSDKEFEIKAKEKTPIISEAPRRKTRIGVSSLRLDQPPPIIDFSKIFPQNARNEVSPPMDIQAENKFPGFETMNFEKLIFDYEVAPLYTQLAQPKFTAATLNDRNISVWNRIGSMTLKKRNVGATIAFNIEKRGPQVIN